jgi:hypothetical protein
MSDSRPVVILSIVRCFSPRWVWVGVLGDAAGEVATGTATTRLVLLGLRGGMALRRGDLETAAPLLEELQPKALTSGEAQRIAPMACVALPWLHLSGRSDELRAFTEEVLTFLRPDAAEETRKRTASVLAPLGCVNAF